MEVGGRLIVDSVDFTVMPRAKVGLVGRNGAGKTSLVRVLGGESEPAAGRVVRKGGFGYLPQDPRIAGVFDGRSAVAHVLSGRGIDEQLDRLEKLRIAMEERPDERNVARYRGPRSTSARPAAMPPTVSASPGCRARDRPAAHRRADRRAIGR